MRKDQHTIARYTLYTFQVVSELQAPRFTWKYSVYSKPSSLTRGGQERVVFEMKTKNRPWKYPLV